MKHSVLTEAVLTNSKKVKKKSVIILLYLATTTHLFDGHTHDNEPARTRQIFCL